MPSAQTYRWCWHLQRRRVQRPPHAGFHIDYLFGGRGSEDGRGRTHGRGRRKRQLPTRLCRQACAIAQGVLRVELPLTCE